MEYKYTGIILSKKDVGEADRIYTIYTKEAGKIQAKAIGVRKTGAKLAGSLENFILADIAVARKQGTGKITGSIAENNFSRLRKNLDALSNVFRVMKNFDRLVGMEEKDEKIFYLALEYLEVMDKLSGSDRTQAALVSQGFAFKLLNLLGYKIEAGVCALCGRRLSDRGNFFSPEQGGAVCGECAGKLKNASGISANTIKIIRIFFTSSLESLAKLKAGESEIKELEQASKTFVDWLTK